MKKVLGILLALFLAIGTTGSALAQFDLDGTFFIAYEEDESVVIQGINDQPGTENFFDLGNSASFNSFVAGLTPGQAVDTNISLADFGTASWDDVFVGIMGKLGPGDFTYFFGSDNPAYEFNAINEGGFSNAHQQLSSLLTAFPNDQLDKGANNNYRVTAQASGTNPGSYGGPVQNAGSFGAEVNLAGISASNAISIGYYGGDLFTDFIDPEGDFVGQFPLIGELDLFLDDDGSLLVGSQVPVPGAVWLLGSGLLALVGIRRKNAK